MNCFYSFRTESKFKSHENVCIDHEYCHMMSKEDKNILKFYEDKQSFKTVFVIYVDTKPLFETICAVIKIQKKFAKQK